MSDIKPPLNASDLLANGFEHACEWELRGGRIRRSATIQPRAGVYAFCVDGIAQYVGVASKNLEQRLYFYGNPGASQRTNLRINALLMDLLTQGGRVAVLVASPPDLDWNGWRIRAAEGLEAGLIEHFHLPWNVRGVSRADTALQRSKTSPSIADLKIRHSGSSSSTGKYGPLGAFLAASGKERISMTFGQIEQLVGQLPKSASLHQARWGNHKGNSQAKAWMGARYLVEANPAGRSVVFRKFSY